MFCSCSFVFCCLLAGANFLNFPLGSQHFQQGGSPLVVGVVKTMGSGPVIGLCWQDGQDLTKEDMKVGAREGGKC